jgi:amidase
VSDDDLCRMSAVDLRAELGAGRVSAREALAAHLDRMERVDPSVNAVVTVVPERAAAAAAGADEAFARGDSLGVLHGLPLAIKDLVQTAGVRTTFGSPVYAGFVPTQDDLLAERILGAGAVLVGKTNTSEWGAGSHTFNPVFGVTRNPYDLSRSAGGSSGGAAAAVAARMLPLADGSDLGGSLRNPAAFCNVVGFRPSPGRVPSWPSSDVWDPLTIEGPIARTVSDAALLLSAIAGPDPRAPLSLDEPGEAFGPTAVEEDPGPVRVAFAPAAGGRMPVERSIVEVLQGRAATFEALGWEVEEAFPVLDGARDVFLTMRTHAYARDLGDLLARERDRIKDTVVWNIEEGQRLRGEDLGRAQRTWSRIHRRVAAFFDRYDVLAMPVTQVPPFPVETEYPSEVDGSAMVTYLDWMESCWCITVTGLPAISVPAGFTADGLPVGIQLVGRRHADLDLLRIAHAFEAATEHWLREPPSPTES